MEKHDEYTLYKKESGNFIIRFMMAPFDCWAKEYKSIKKLVGVEATKPFLVIKYNKSYDDEVPRKKGEGINREEWINNWTSHNWYDTSEKALAKYKSL